jgi:hypothetical protein
MTPATIIQWTLRLADAALIHDTLLAAAQQATSSADYLESDRYAEQQREARLAKPKEERGAPWTLSAHDLQRIADARGKAARLQELADA